VVGDNDRRTGLRDDLGIYRCQFEYAPNNRFYAVSGKKIEIAIDRFCSA
jgi:hypothetical protein